MKTLWQDLRYGVRMLMKRPGLTLIAALSLALGIGANTSIFSIVNALFLRQLPVSEPDKLMFVFNGRRGNPWSVVSYPNYVDYRDKNEVFSELAAYGKIIVSLSGDERPDQVNGTIVTGNYFATLGARAALGRAISPEDDKTPNAHPVVVLSHRLWQSRFGGNRNVIGREIALNGNKFTIIGVAPAGFEGAEILEKSDIYTPMMMQAVARPPRGGFSGEMNPDLLQRRGPSWLRMIGRLKPGVTMEQAQAGISTLASQLEKAYPSENEGTIATLFPVSKVDPRGYTPLVTAAALLMSVVGMVLLIACANVANLLLARASARRKEIAVRLAMGASRSRLIRQLLTESVLLGILGGVAGLLIAIWTIDVLKTTPPPVGVFSFNLDFGVDGHVLWFTFGLSLLTGIVFGLAPALQSSRPDLLPSLKDESYAPVQSRRWFAMRNLLVVAQVALSLAPLIGAGLFLRSLWRIQSVHPGFDADKVLTASLSINLLRYTTRQGREFYRQTVERVGSLPGVEYQPLAQNHETGMTLHVRAAGDPMNIAAAVRREVNSIEKNLPLTDLQPMSALIGASLYPARMGAVLIGVFGLLALLLAAVGLYGVMSYAVSQRTREIGVRMALGAQARDVLRLVLREAMTLVVIGMTIGWGLAAALSRLIESFLFGVGSMDAVTFAAIPILLTMVALLASYLPARRAMKVDPLVALRCD